LAFVGGVVLVQAARRAFAAWRATSRTAREWQRTGYRIDPLTLGIETAIPVYAIDELFPMVAVVGIVRPVLFVSARVLTECSADEVRAIVAHECAHVDARDNLKRFVLRACPDFVGIDGVLSRAWASATEQAADAGAIASRPDCALDLAQALIRVARLTAPVAPMLASAFYPGGSIEVRVRRLVNPPVETAAPAVLRNWVVALAAVVFVACVAFAAPAVHRAMEFAVRQLP
jgi:beta-lactamase regulating signal transducer with metallopeptidase domain